MDQAAREWRRAVAEIRRLTGTYVNRALDTSRLEDIASAVSADPATVDRTLQGTVDPPLTVAARLARRAGAALVAVPAGHEATPAVPGAAGPIEPAVGDVAALQATMRRLRSETGLSLPAYALACGLPLAHTAVETDPANATLGGVCAFAANLGFGLRIVAGSDVEEALAAARSATSPAPPAGPLDRDDADADVDWIRRAMEEAMDHTRLDAVALARRVHMPEAVSRDPTSCRLLGPFKTTASLAAGLGFRLTAVDRSERDPALIALGTSLSSPGAPPGLSQSGARYAARLQEKDVLEAVRRRRADGGRGIADLADACGASERSVQEVERGLMPIHVQRIARHAQALGLALVLRAA
ncbi:hypothetical protein PQI07_26170 [Methylobacterium sp. 092160098-2]|uniref:hypothetical protein n=1 Tax=Methylobacterium sp. 092160098-2 TaxID=3025129 RepID=UPI002381C9CD|nr:hypothetical protein [Methylobacterium sp. 092160098-2]MDE4914159.1 hypothetical protein [Methylobacterium sp. 092160098-2]